MSNFNKWMIINDVSMISWVQLLWSCLVVENELFWLNCNWIAMNCIAYMVNCNSAIHATCPWTLTVYKYNELQISFATQKLNYKANCKTPIFLIVPWHNFESLWLILSSFNVATWDKWKSLEIMLNNNI